MNVYEKSSVLECSVEDLYAFHLDVSNLKRITPPYMEATLTNEKSFVAKEGATLFIETKHGFLSTSWVVEIVQMKKPLLIVDKAIKSPFAHWEHFHEFRDLGDEMCELLDRVEYKLPLGWFGAMFDFVALAQFEKMFAHRHEATKLLLEQRSR